MCGRDELVFSLNHVDLEDQIQVNKPGRASAEPSVAMPYSFNFLLSLKIP